MNSKTAFSKKDVIVIVLCGIFLAATVGSVGVSGRIRAKQAVCLSNLRQWGTVFAAYAQDNEGSTLSGPGIPGAEDWMCSLLPYYKEEKLLLCPMAVRPWKESAMWGARDLAWWLLGDRPEVRDCDFHPAVVTGSYGINDYCWNAAPGELATWEEWSATLCWRSFYLNQADTVPLLADCIHIGGFPQHTDEPPLIEDMPWTSSNGEAGMARFCMNRHEMGTINALFMDFSVRPVGLKELWTLKWNRRFIPHGPWTTAGGVQPGDWPEWMRDFPDY